MNLISIEITLVQLLVTSAIINSLTFAALILSKKANRIANRFLALLLLSLCLTFTPYVINEAVFDKNLWLTWLPFSLTYWIGPALYFYIRSLTLPKAKFARKHLWHFSLIALNYVHGLYHILVPHQDSFTALHKLGEVLEVAAILSVFVYAWFSFRLLNSYNQSILDQLSSTEHFHLKWIGLFIKALVVMFSVIGLYLIIDNELITRPLPNQRLLTYGDIFLGLYAIAMYWLSIRGYQQVQTINNPIDLSIDHHKKLSNESLVLLLDKMKDHQYYLDPTLSLKSLSEKSGISERDISALLKNELGKNFYRFVNEYRVEEVKKRLLNRANEHLKIISLAYDSGFNSKATFNRIFKQQTGLSPQEYRKKSIK